MSAARMRLRAPPGRAPNGRLTMGLGNGFSFRPVEETGQNDVRCRANWQGRDVHQPAPGPVPAATQGEGPEAPARLIATATALTLLAGGGSHMMRAPATASRSRSACCAHCGDMAQHLRDPEAREQTVEMLVAHRCMRVACTIWPTD